MMNTHNISNASSSSGGSSLTVVNAAAEVTPSPAALKSSVTFQESHSSSSNADGKNVPSVTVKIQHLASSAKNQPGKSGGVFHAPLPLPNKAIGGSRNTESVLVRSVTTVSSMQSAEEETQ